MSKADLMQTHDEWVKGLFALYNALRFEEMLTQFCDDVICFLPTILDGPEEVRWSQGKEAYRANLEIFYDLFGRLAVQGVFATEDSSSVIVIDELGNTGAFSFEVTPERKVRRIFFHHQPAGAADTGLDIDGRYTPSTLRAA